MRNYFNSVFGKAERILGLTGAFMLLPFTLLLPLLPAGLGLALTANVNALGGITKRSVFEYVAWIIIYYYLYCHLMILQHAFCQIFTLIDIYLL